MAYDEDGNLYVADAFNHAIRKIDPSNRVTTYAGKSGTQGNIPDSISAVPGAPNSGSGDTFSQGSARFAFPTDLLIDGEIMYVIDDWGIKKIDMNRNMVTVYKTREQLFIGKTSGMKHSRGIWQDRGKNIWIAEPEDQTTNNKNRIIKVTAEGQVHVIIDVDNSYDASAVQNIITSDDFQDIVSDGAGNFYTVSADSHRIHKLTPPIKVIADRPKPSSPLVPQINNPNDPNTYNAAMIFAGPPRGLASDPDFYNPDIEAPPDRTTTLVDGPGDDARFFWPKGLLISGPFLYVADTYNDAIRRIDLATREVTTLQLTGVSLKRPVKMTLAPNGRDLIVSDSHRILKITGSAAR